MHPFKERDEVQVSVNVIPRGGVIKLLRSLRGPSKVSEVRREGRWYILEIGMITHHERLKPYIPRVTEMEIEARPEQEEIVLDDESREREPTEEIEPEDDISSNGTFDAETSSELSFTAPRPNQVEPSDMVLRPRARVDYHKVENPIPS